MDCSLAGSSVHGIPQARILEWVAISFSRESSRPRNQTQVSCIAGRFFTDWAPREAQGHSRKGISFQDTGKYLWIVSDHQSSMWATDEPQT